MAYDPRYLEQDGLFVIDEKGRKWVLTQDENDNGNWSSQPVAYESTSNYLDQMIALRAPVADIPVATSCVCVAVNIQLFKQSIDEKRVEAPELLAAALKER